MSQSGGRLFRRTVTVGYIRICAITASSLSPSSMVGFWFEGLDEGGVPFGEFGEVEEL